MKANSSSPSRSGQPQTNAIRVKAAVLAAIGAGLLAASVFLGIAATAEWAPCAAVHDLWPTAARAGPPAASCWRGVTRVVGLLGLALVAVAVGALVQREGPVDHHGASALMTGADLGDSIWPSRSSLRRNHMQP
jgi:hypothetical protein